MHQQRVLSEFLKHLPHLREALCEPPHPAGAQQVVAVRYKRAPHPFESAWSPIPPSIHHAVTRLDLERRLPIKYGSLRRPAETMLGIPKINRSIELAEKLTIPA
jgi:hypothetical protein